MNPSAPDWIKKVVKSLQKNPSLILFNDVEAFYIALRKSGFLYGASIKQPTLITNAALKFTVEEHTRVNLFYGLLYIHFKCNPNDSYDQALAEILKFYKTQETEKLSFFKHVSSSKDDANTLEKIIAKRVQESSTIFKSSAISLLTYALLFVDVLGYDKWLIDKKHSKQHLLNFENVIITCSYLALKSKKHKNKYDKLLVSLFESSATYMVDQQLVSKSLVGMDFNPYSPIEKQYILDICCLAVYEDAQMDHSELHFLNQLNEVLDLAPHKDHESIEALKLFAASGSKKVRLFNYATPIKQFYKQSTTTVQRLILRNKDRLMQELRESKELVVLLTYSTRRELSKTEKKKIKEQLLDICKTIPSLTIFLLPGGTILLPLLIKFIPKLLPSAFDENRIDSTDV